jgi:hypothetical protein
MEFISSAILGGLLWDTIKMGVPITLEHIKKKAQGYIVDETIVAKIDDLTQQTPDRFKASKSELISYIETEDEWKKLRSEVVKVAEFSQNINGDNAKGVQANTVTTLNM